MKDNKLYAAIGHIDEKWIDEAVNTHKTKRFPIRTVSAIAAALVIAAVSAAFLINGNQQPEQAAASNDPVIEATAQPAESEPSATEPQKAPSPGDEDESSEMLGYIIKDEKVYYHVFYNTKYTIDQEIGFARDFPGAYRHLDDDSRVYSVKEDERILVVKLASGGIVTLMLSDEDEQDQMGYYSYHGLRVDRSLMAALLSSDGKAYSVSVHRPDSDDMYDYVYNGRTLREIKDELDESWKTADTKNNPLEAEYQAALGAFLKEKIKAICDALTANGIDAEIINGVWCEATMTKEQFEAFAGTGSYDEYAFSLLNGNDCSDDPEA